SRRSTSCSNALPSASAAFRSLRSPGGWMVQPERRTPTATTAATRTPLRMALLPVFLSRGQSGRRKLPLEVRRVTAQTEALGDEEDDRIDEQFHEEAREQPAEHRRREPPHHVSPGPRRPEERHEADKGGGDRHRLGPDALHGPVVDRVPEVVRVLHPALR